MSDHGMQRKLHLDLSFNPYKMMAAQELNQCDWLSLKSFAENILAIWTNGMVFLMSDEAHFLVALISKDFCF